MGSRSDSWPPRLRAPFFNPIIEDLAIATIVTAVALISMFASPGDEAGFKNNDLVGVALVLLSTVSLAARRIAPLGTLVAVEIGLLAHNALGYAPIQAMLFASLIAVYSATLYTIGWLSIVTLLISLGSVTVFFATTQAAFFTGSSLSAYVQWGAIWLLGLIHRLSRERMGRLEERNALLEQNSELRTREKMDQERQRITRELHDGVGHAMNVVVILAGAAQRVFEAQPEKVKESLVSIESTSREALTDTERMLATLQQAESDALSESGLGVGVVDELATRVTAAGLPVQVTQEGPPRILPPDIDYAAYRIIQESLTNSLKHAGDARARVTISYEPEGLELNISDDVAKPGQQPAQTGSGLGIQGMVKRVNEFGGRLEAGTQPGGGFRVNAWLPIEES
jgi:signal transduction histidine kinase